MIDDDETFCVVADDSDIVILSLLIELVVDWEGLLMVVAVVVIGSCLFEKKKTITKHSKNKFNQRESLVVNILVVNVGLRGTEIET